MNSFMDTKDLIADEDLIASSAPETEIAGKEAALQLLDEMAGGLSARERNKLKRKVRSGRLAASVSKSNSPGASQLRACGSRHRVARGTRGIRSRSHSASRGVHPRAAQHGGLVQGAPSCPVVWRSNGAQTAPAPCSPAASLVRLGSHAPSFPLRGVNPPAVLLLGVC